LFLDRSRDTRAVGLRPYDAVPDDAHGDRKNTYDDVPDAMSYVVGFRATYDTE